MGDLETGRYGHGSISDGAQTIIIGGNVSGWAHTCLVQSLNIKLRSNAETEIWTLENNESLNSKNPILPGGQYRYGPALFLVDDEFC